jgi:hypothetical protein
MKQGLPEARMMGAKLDITFGLSRRKCRSRPVGVGQIRTRGLSWR